MTARHDKQAPQHEDAAARRPEPQSAEAGAAVNNSTMQTLFGPGEGSRALPHRALMEQAFGQSFADVQSRVGVRRALDAIGAHAASSGNAVAFPHDSPDVETVAHELAHVVQHRSGRAAPPGLSSPNDANEQEAERVAADVAAAAGSSSAAATSSGAWSTHGGGDASPTNASSR